MAIWASYLFSYLFSSSFIRFAWKNDVELRSLINIKIINIILFGFFFFFFFFSLFFFFFNF